VQTLGIDLAAEPKKTGVAWVRWERGEALVTDLAVGATDAELIDAMSQAAKTGIDCPLGWPRAFVEFISAHQEDHVLTSAEAPTAWRKTLSYRVTDLHVKSTVPGIQGLSVSSDRIGVTTMRCAALLSGLADAGRAVLRTGSGPVAEVYPAASLVRWGFNHKGYKGRKGQARRSLLVDELLLAAPWLKLDEYEEACRHSDDALDAVLAAMTARAAAAGLTETIPAAALRAAEVEGWIALPRPGTLTDLEPAT
jgi:predicted nuclease with RNAse H fold